MANRKSLTRRRELIGAHGVFVHAVIWQPFVMLFTTQTAIARFGTEYGFWAQVLAISVESSLLILYADFWAAIADLYWGKRWTDNPVMVWVDAHRPWFLYLASIWLLMLMTTVKAESGIGAVLSYGLFFVGLSCVGLFMALRDGCVENELQKDGVCGDG